MERERERDRYERERERERLHARERDLMHYDINNEELLDERNYAADYPPHRGAVGGGVGAGPHTHLSRGSRLVVDDADLIHERDDLRGGRYSAGATARVIDPRDLPPSAPTTRRGAPVVDRDEYSPHRGGGSSRRMLNAM